MMDRLPEFSFELIPDKIPQDFSSIIQEELFSQPHKLESVPVAVTTQPLQNGCSLILM